MRGSRFLAGLLTICTLAVASPAGAQPGIGSPNMKHVTTLAYTSRYGSERPQGTDLEFARIGGRDYALAGTYRNGLQIIDVTDPRRPRRVAVYDCAIAQGDVQVFRRGSRTIVAYTADDYEQDTFISSRCFRDIRAKEIRYGTFLVDVTTPSRPKTAGFVAFAKGSHNQTVHPGGRYLYNSNADFGFPGAIEIVDIADLSRPRLVGELSLGETGLESHDITFSSDGKRAYSAALTHTLVLDTTDPRRPAVIGRIVDPALNIHHQADPITVDDPLLGRRRFLVVTDEFTGAAGNGFCPGGGLHVYDITGDLERTPLKVGFWAIPEVRPSLANLICTSHVLRFYPKQRLMTIAWYGAGVRVVDVSGLAGLSVGVTPDVGNVGAGLREVGYYEMPDAHTWSAKTNRFAKDGSFYLFGNDMNRGLDVYRFDAKAPRSAVPGLWLTPARALTAAGSRPPASTDRPFAPACLVLKRA